MGKQSRLTVLLGAGAMMDVTTLSCSSITQSVIARPQRVFKVGKWETTPFLNFVYEQLKDYYAKEKDNANFEDIFHTLEMLSSIQTANNEQAIKSARSVFGMLCNIKDDFGQISSNLVYGGMSDLIETVIENVAAFETETYRDKWFSDFFKSVQHKMSMDVFNYKLWHMVGTDP